MPAVAIFASVSDVLRPQGFCGSFPGQWQFPALWSNVTLDHFRAPSCTSYPKANLCYSSSVYFCSVHCARAWHEHGPSLRRIVYTLRTQKGAACPHVEIGSTYIGAGIGIYVRRWMLPHQRCCRACVRNRPHLTSALCCAAQTVLRKDSSSGVPPDSACCELPPRA